MMEFIIGIFLGMVLLYLFSKYYCFKNREEWEKFKKNYEIKWQ
jgi:hypothetical protein